MSSAEHAPAQPPEQTYHTGFGVVTVIGMCLVAAEHYFTLIDRPVLFHGQSVLGSLGVFCFLLMSGYHAAGTARSPTGWLERRLMRIYPAYWVVIAVSFLAVWLTGIQAFDTWQVISQLSGFGYFTHRDSLLLQPTWFISPLIVSYFAVFLMRLTRRERLLSAVALIGTAALVTDQASSSTSLSFLAFAIGYFVSTTVPPKRHLTAFLAWGVCCSLVVPVESHVSRLGWAACLMAAGLAIVKPIPIVRHISDRSYEFYLVHGLTFFAALRYLQWGPLAGGVAAFTGSVLLTELLHRFDLEVRRRREKPRIARAAQTYQASPPPGISSYNPLECADR